MKDRIPLSNGKNNKIKLDLSNITTFDELKAANTAGTLKADVFANNDGTGTQEIGTALNKANLLSDTTATKLGLTPANNPTVNDAFYNLDLPKIGDIKTTVRTDLGSKWLLCNGADINSSVYPELNSLMPDVSFLYGAVRKFTFTDGDKIEDIYYDGTQYIVLTSYSLSSTIYYRLWTATTLSSLSDLTLVNSVTLSLYTSYDYANRNAHLGRLGKIGSKYVMIIANTIQGSYDSDGVYFSALVLNFYYFTSPSGTLSLVQSLTSGNSYSFVHNMSQFIVANNTISIAICSTNSKGSAGVCSSIFSSTTGTTWTTLTLTGLGSITGYPTLYGYGYYNGVYYLAYSYLVTTSLTNYGIIKSSDLVTWTTIKDSSSPTILGMTYLNGIFYYGNGSILCYTTDFVTIKSLTGDASGFLWTDGVDIYCSNKKLILGASSFTAVTKTIPLSAFTLSTFIYVTNKIIGCITDNSIVNLTLDAKKLPEISPVGNANTLIYSYIKALN